MSNRIMVTGATGFVGSYLMTALRQKWPNASILGVGHRKDTLNDELEINMNFDLLDPASVSRAVELFLPTLVIHLAAQSSATISLQDSDLTWRANLGGSLSLALALSKHAPTAVLLYVSSSEVFGASFFNSPVDENTQLLPLNSYAKSKMIAEKVFVEALPSTCRLIIARPFNHTGVGQKSTFVLPSFAYQISRIERGNQPPILEVGNLNVSRDFLDVRDVVRAYIALCCVASTLPSRFTVNIASGRPQLLSEILSYMRTISKKHFEIIVDTKRLRTYDMPLIYAQPTLLKSVTDWNPIYPFSETLNDLVISARQSI